jgi:hypothetical protein
MGLEDARLMLRDRHRKLLDSIDREFQEDLEFAARAERVGKIEWLGDRACRFYYFDTKRSRTLSRIRSRTMKHTHDLVDARKVRLPADHVKKPKMCRNIIRAMPLWMRKHSYIVVGTQVVGNIERVDQTEEPNELLAAAKWAGRKLTRAHRKAVRAGKGAVRTASGLNRLTTAILRDPALVIGDYVLTGWEG